MIKTIPNEKLNVVRDYSTLTDDELEQALKLSEGFIEAFAATLGPTGIENFKKTQAGLLKEKERRTQL